MFASFYCARIDTTPIILVIYSYGKKKVQLYFVELTQYLSKTAIKR